MGALAVLSAAGQMALAATKPKIPVILDTDIGDDIDDTWALLMLLRMPQFDVKLVVGDYGNAIYRARLLAKLLDRCGRADVPVAIGVDSADERGQQSDWLGDYKLNDYPGTIYEDGVQKIIEIINESPEPVTLLCIGPVPNIAEALRRDPGIADNASFVGMHGSVFVGYNGSAQPDIEWNVRVDPQSLQKVFAAPWDCTITPLDTCGLIKLQGENYRRLYESNDTWLKILFENYRAWLPGAPYVDPDTDTSKISTTLFDTVAVYLAAEQDLLEMQDVPLRVTDDGWTLVDAVNGRTVHCATAWKDLAAFEEKLVDILLG
ncbi:MAG: inosine-uridine nucleoside N-ribohydrolase [Woeseiaceae bacterium]